MALGCDREVAQAPGGTVVLGAVLDYLWLGAGGDAAFSGMGQDTRASVKLKRAASLRGRLGYASGNTLYYATAGLARGQIKARVSDQTGPAMMEVSQDGGRSGWVAGVGIAWELAERRQLDLSLMHYDFGKVTSSGVASDPVAAYPRFDHKVTADVLRIGLNWRF